MLLIFLKTKWHKPGRCDRTNDIVSYKIVFKVNKYERWKFKEYNWFLLSQTKLTWYQNIVKEQATYLSTKQ